MEAVMRGAAAPAWASARAVGAPVPPHVSLLRAAQQLVAAARSIRSWSGPQHHARIRRRICAASMERGSSALSAPVPGQLGYVSSDEPTAPAPEGATPSSSSGSQSEDDGAATIDLELPRRSLLVTFTCNRCDGRTERLVNPIAWERGMVIAQCANCQVWHKLADAANLVEEIRYSELEDE